MKILRYDETDLTLKIEQLSRRQRAAFAAACAERLNPCYVRYSAITGKGNSDKLSEVQFRLWCELSDNVMSERDIERLIEVCVELFPKEDDGPWIPEKSEADDAAAALAYALRCRLTGLSQEAAWAARRSYETLEEYIILDLGIDINNHSELEGMVMNSLVQAELGRQQRDLDELLRDAVTIEKLRERSVAEATSFLPGLDIDFRSL